MILDSVYPDDARITNQCDELIKKNHEIHLFCLSFNNVFIENEVINKINIHVLFRIYDLVLGVKPAG